MRATPLFYLASTEDYALQEVRACTEEEPLPGRRAGGGYLYVGINPVIIGQQFGLGERDVDRVVLAPRHPGVTLTPLSESPASVHVAMLLISRTDALRGLTKNDLKIIGLGRDLQNLERSTAVCFELGTAIDSSLGARNSKLS